MERENFELHNERVKMAGKHETITAHPEILYILYVYTCGTFATPIIKVELMDGWPCMEMSLAQN